MRLVPRGRVPFGQLQESRPLAGSIGSNTTVFQRGKSAIHGRPVTLRMLRVKYGKSDWFRSHSVVFAKPIRAGISLNLSRGRASRC